jgi:hypothetical protein
MVCGGQPNCVQTVAAVCGSAAGAAAARGSAWHSSEQGRVGGTVHSVGAALGCGGGQ